MEPEKINFWKKFLFRSFLTGCLFYIFSVLIILIFRGAWISLSQSVFHIQQTTWWEIVLMFLVGAKLVLLFFMLVPALVLHWCTRGRK